MLALAGRLSPKQYSGQIKYNDHTFADFCAARTAVFVPQVDAHIPNLTAGETARFSYDMLHGPHGTPAYGLDRLDNVAHWVSPMSSPDLNATIDTLFGSGPFASVLLFTE